MSHLSSRLKFELSQVYDSYLESRQWFNSHVTSLRVNYQIESLLVESFRWFYYTVHCIIIRLWFRFHEIYEGDDFTTESSDIESDFMTLANCVTIANPRGGSPPTTSSTTSRRRSSTPSGSTARSGSTPSAGCPPSAWCSVSYTYRVTI